MRTPIAACLIMLLALPASAQIYSYTDASGKQVHAVDRRNGYPLPYRLSD